MNHSGVPVELETASRTVATQLESLLDEYLRELNTHRDEPVGATDSASYPYLEAYWTEPGRHAFIIHCGADVGGFAFIRDPSSTDSGVHELAEFYVRPESRRLGVGQRALHEIWRRFPGRWELQVHARNLVALQFWTACVEDISSEAPDVSEVDAADGKRIQFNFHVPATAGQDTATEPDGR